MIDFTTIDPQELISKTREIASANPDFVYYSDEYKGHRACRYTEKNGEPGCIFGHALKEMGIDIPFESEVNIQGIWNLGIPFTSAQENWACYVQDHQDLGLSWLIAVIYSDKSLADDIISQ